MSATHDHLAYESRTRPRMAWLAGVAGLLIIAASALQVSGPQAAVTEATIGLINEYRRGIRDILGGAIIGVGTIGAAITLAYLIDRARARNPQIAPYWRWIALVGGVVSGISAVANAVVEHHDAVSFVSHGQQTYMQAHALTSGGAIPVLDLGGVIGTLLLTFAFIWVALNAMRVGLLTRGMGYIGIAAGVLTIFPILPIPIVEAFWLLALAYLLSGRWPSGVPASWSSGKAEPWPTAAEVRAQREAAAGQRAGRAKRPERADEPATVTSTATAVEEEDPATPRTRSATPKRKRKRRR